MPGHPSTRFLLAIDSKFERTASGDAAEALWKFFVVFEFQPINQAVPIAMRMNSVQQLLSIQLA